MIILKLSFTVIAIISLFLSLNKEGGFQKVLTIGFSIILVSTWFEHQLISSFFMLLPLSLLTLIYGATVKSVDKFGKASITLLGLFIFINTYFKISHYPFQTELNLALIVPIILSSIFIIKSKLPKESGFLIIWIFISFLNFLSCFNIF